MCQIKSNQITTNHRQHSHKEPNNLTISPNNKPHNVCFRTPPPIQLLRRGHQSA